MDLVNRKYTSEVNVVWLWYQLGKTSKIKTTKVYSEGEALQYTAASAALITTAGVGVER